MMAIEWDLLASLVLVLSIQVSSNPPRIAYRTPRCTPPSLFYVMMKLGPGKGKVFMSLALCSQTPAMKTDQRFALSSAAAVPSDPLLFLFYFFIFIIKKGKHKGFEHNNAWHWD